MFHSFLFKFKYSPQATNVYWRVSLGNSVCKVFKIYTGCKYGCPLKPGSELEPVLNYFYFFYSQFFSLYLKKPASDMNGLVRWFWSNVWSRVQPLLSLSLLSVWELSVWSLTVWPNSTWKIEQNRVDFLAEAAAPRPSTSGQISGTMNEW